MPDDSQARAELALAGPSGGRFLLAAATASSLLDLLAAASTSCSPQIMQLASQDPSFAAWLMDGATGGYRQGSAGEPLREPAAWLKIATTFKQWTQKSPVQLVGSNATTVWLTDAEYNDWEAAQSHLARELLCSMDTCSVGRQECLDARVLWTNYLLAWILTPGEAGRPVGWWALDLHLPKHDPGEANEWEAFAQSVVERLDAMPQPSTTTWLAGASSACTYEAIIRRLYRLEELESHFDAVLEGEKIAAMKELAYGASHEINNPLANISSRAQMLLRGERDAERRRALATINSQAFRAHEMIADMMLFAKPPKLQRELLVWGDFVADVVESWQDELPEGVTWNWTNQAVDVRINADPAQLATAIHAIWKNAIEAVGDAGEISVHASRAESDSDNDPGWAQLEIRDTGPGIRPEVRRHLFDPFYSGREAGRGLGFGLSKAWSIVELHGGTIIAHSDVGGPTSITTRIPAIRAEVRE